MKKKLFWIIGLLAGALAAFGWWAFRDLPDLDDLPARLNTPSVRIEDRHGRLLYESLPADGGRHAVTPFADIPLACRQAAVAVEDRGFYEHAGVDITGITRAVWINLRRGHISAGGSTITQQAARTVLLAADERQQRSLRRKLREAALAVLLERRFSKDEILALYLNQTYYGGMAYGIGAAAQTFFGRSVAELDLAQCALLAGLPQAPALYNPFTDPDAARARQADVLRLMETAGYLATEQRLLAEREPLAYTESPYPIEAPHFAMMARAAIDRLFTPADIYRYGGLAARTTLDLDWQRLAEDAVRRQLDELRRSDDGLGHNVNNAALIALDPHTGQVLALVGSPDYFDAQNGGAINMALSPRQPGSALKPLVYAAALTPGAPGGGWTAATMLLDVSTSFVTHEGQAYVPANYDLQEHGPVLAREALASSLNIPAVLALEHIGLENFFAFAKKLGISTLGDPQNYDLSLSLGGGEVRLLDLAGAYAALANGGYLVAPQILIDVRSASGEVVYTSPAPEEARVIDARVAWLISDILSDNDARRLGFGPTSLLRIDRPAAVKTGTTSNFHDNWTVGYTPELVVGVWSGNTSYESMRGVNGLSGAGPIWHQFMRAALAGRPAQPFERPAGLAQARVCALTGLLPGKRCPYTRSEWFIDGTQPQQEDTYYREVFVDTQTGALAGPETPPERRRSVLALDLPPQAFAWARRHNLTLYADLQRRAAPVPADTVEAQKIAVAPLSADATALHIIAPASGSRFRLSRMLPAEDQRIRLEAVGPANLRRVTLFIDGVEIARFSSAPYIVWWPLVPGPHRLAAQAILPDGAVLTAPEVTFSVE